MPTIMPVEDLQILDVVLVVNEVVDSILTRNKGVIMCKLDIEKANDHMD